MRPIHYFLTISIGICLSACTKDVVNPRASTSLTIVNAIPGSDNLVTNFTGNSGSKVTDILKWYRNAMQISYDNYAEFSSYSGATYLALSQISDTMHTVWKGTLNLWVMPSTVFLLQEA